MFKNATLYRLGNQWAGQAAQLEEQLAKAKFTPCMPTQLKSIGWTEPRGIEHAALLEVIDGQWIMKLMVEKKDLPGAVVNRELEEQVKKIEQETGRKVGRRERKEIKESVILALLPNAYTKRALVTVWIDPEECLLVIDSTSKGHLDDVITFLVKTIDGIQINPIQTQKTPEASMAEWLLEGAVSQGLEFGGECDLKAVDESKAGVKYSRHRLDIEEVQAHIKAGKRPQSLSLVRPDKISFTLTTTGQIKKIKLIDVKEEGSQDEDPFDSTVALMTGELSTLIDELLELLGGELKIEL